MTPSPVGGARPPSLRQSNVCRKRAIREIPEVIDMRHPKTQRRWEVTNDVAPSVYFGIDRKLTGVYTLEFKGGEKYVGKTVDLTSRIASHRRRWDDIIAISFIECGHAELDALERTMITQTEQSFRIRNKMLTRMPAGEAEIDLVVDKEQQAEWLEGVQPSYWAAPFIRSGRCASRRFPIDGCIAERSRRARGTRVTSAGGRGCTRSSSRRSRLGRVAASRSC